MMRVWIFYPIFVLFLMGGGIAICYGIAVTTGAVQRPPIWPTVSETGVRTPARGWFTMFLTWGSFFILASVYCYYKRIDKGLVAGYSPNTRCCRSLESVKRCNCAALVFGVFGSQGVTVVSSFQTNCDKLTTTNHFAGALIAFISLTVYAWLVAFVSFSLQRLSCCDKFWATTRAVLAVLVTFSFITFVMGIGVDRKNNINPNSNLTTISEWIMIYLAILYVFTLIGDLKKIEEVKMEFGLIEEASHREGNPNPGFNLSPLNQA
ncbi:unnamed protein product [Clavelina lepadiformis]|uniref:CWH43-like N-terminal domain-containing protein n=1 Tax=Clavelina lepadiformis TaxID=159417 RepID=A0ABP0FNE9_CLALP